MIPTPKPSQWITPNWPVAPHIHAISTTRQGGYSEGAFSSMNLGAHVNDAIETVQRNRDYLRETLKLPSEPFWLQQVHGTEVLELDQKPQTTKADAAISRSKETVCVIMTADCMPVLFTDTHGTTIAAAHAGWRGLCGGVLENTLEHFQCPMADILVWLGPAIGAKIFEVGDDVHTAFLEAADARKLDIKETAQAFRPSPSTATLTAPNTQKKWLADLYALAQQRLQAYGVKAIYSDQSCTFSDAERFYSYRRAAQTGRMATLIWMSEA